MTSIIKGTRADNCHCCPPYSAYDPTKLNPLSVQYVSRTDPAELSDGHNRAIIYELEGDVSLTSESVIDGAASGSATVVSHGVGAVSPGSRRVVIDVTTTDDPWVAGVILWDDSGYTYDPKEKGSISKIAVQLATRWTKETNTLQRSFSGGDSIGQPYPIFTTVIEQDGNRYFGFEHDPTVQTEDDECWRGKAGGPEDGNGLQYLGRLARHGPEGWHSGTGAVPDRGGGNFRLGRCDDWMGTLGLTNAGEFDIDDRPDISYDSAVSRTVTRFGIFIGLMSEPYDSHDGATRADAGDYVYDILIDQLLLSVWTWGVPKVFDADIGQPPDFGTTYVDEPMTSIPADWTISPAGIDDPITGFQESCADGGVAEVIDGLVGNRTTFGGEYTALRMATNPIVPPISETGTVTVEFTWHTVDERDHVKPLGDADDPDLSRRVWSGIWLDDAFRFLATKEGDMWEHPCGNSNWEMQGQISGEGGRKFQSPINSVYGGDDYLMTSNGKYTANGCLDGRHEGRAAPMDGDRITIMIRHQFTFAEWNAINTQLHLNVTNGVYERPPFHVAYPEARFLAYAWINGRVMNMGFFRSLPGSFTPWTPSPIVGAFLWFGGNGTGPLTIGCLGMCGGRWSNVRLKVRP